jgi:hypothetical protein
MSLFYGVTLFSLPFFSVVNDPIPGVKGGSSAVGGLVGGLGLLPALIGTALMFGCACHIINRFEAGHVSSSDIFDSSSMIADLWDVVILGIAILLAVTWPLLLIVGFGLGDSKLVWVSLLWMLLYYPMALLAAAETDRFLPTVSPFVGLVAIYRMRSVYWKLLLMYLTVSGVATIYVAGVIVTMLPAGFNPIIYMTMGIVIAPGVFYANMVIGCLIGRAVFKSGDRLTV